MRPADAVARITLAIVFALSSPGHAAAQSVRPVELWGAFSGVVDGPAGTLASSYTPPLLFGTALASSGDQILTMNGGRGPGWQAGINLFPSRHLGLQVLVDRAAIDLSGVNGPYTLSLKWVTQQPPDYQPHVFATSGSTPWPDTAGSFEQLTIGINAVARTAASGPVSASVSGGVSVYRLTGTAQPLGYTEYHLGGHSVLFSNDFRLAFDFEPTTTLGFNLGGDINIAIGRHAALIAGYRYLGGRTIDIPVRLTSITNPDEIVFGEPIDTIAGRMPIGPARMSLSGSRVIVGMKVTP